MGGGHLSFERDLRPDVMKAIDASPGMAHVNRTHARSFSLNIFRANARELIAITQQVRDPQEGLRLWFVDNREEQAQTHREVKRHVHNFVLAAKTLIDHTREFIKEHYANMPVFVSYNSKIKAEFSEAPVAKFVQDLRNYMTHRGLPSSDLFFQARQNPDRPEDGQTLVMGVQYRTEELLQWDRWTAPARKYIEEADEHLQIHVFAEDYVERVLRFHAWLDAELNAHHAADLEHLRSLQDEFGRLAAREYSRVGGREAICVRGCCGGRRHSDVRVPR